MRQSEEMPKKKFKERYYRVHRRQRKGVEPDAGAEPAAFRSQSL